jgi:2-polyprenyl-3-methyl-5-hydroxy-6-metoxy-1,4-benzoquinol methylase
MREMPCLFCGVHDEQLRFHDGDYRVVECKRCGLVYVNPRLPSGRLHEMYQDEYWTSDRAKEFGYTGYLADAPLYLRTYRVRSQVIDRYKPQPGSVLDVGCAAGFFLAVMAEKGWRTTGIEISKPMVEYAQNDLSLDDMHRGELLSVDLGDSPPFDVITLWDVIEHLEQPDAYLDRVAELLADDGVLVLETQNVDSRFARLMGKRWQHYKHEEHLYHFQPESLSRLLKDAGFQIVENTSKRGGKFVSLSFLVERLGKVHPALSALASPLRLVGNKSLYVNLADEMIVVAKKA